MAVVAEILAKLAVSILEWWAAREDLKKSVRADDALAAAKMARKALEWKAYSAATPGGGAELRVRDNAPTIQLPGDDPGPPSGARVPSMRGERGDVGLHSPTQE